MVSQPQHPRPVGASVTAEELELQCIRYIDLLSQIKARQSELSALKIEEARLNCQLLSLIGPVSIPILYDGAQWLMRLTDRIGEYHEVTRLTGLDEIAANSNGGVAS